VSNFTTSDGTQLYYKDWGAGQPIILMHAWPLNSDTWEYQMNFLAARGFRVIAYDRRGFGRSSQPWAGYDFDTFANDLHQLIEGLELQDVVLVGHSMGGGEVARYLGRHGSRRVAKAVLVSAVTPLMIRRDDHPEGIAPAVFDGLRAGILSDRSAFLSKLVPVLMLGGQGNPAVSQPMLDATVALGLQAGLKGMLDSVEAFSATDFRADLKKIDVPTLVIHGDCDGAVPFEVTGKAAAAMIRDVRLKVYEGAPHSLYFTHKDRLNEDLLAFAQS
jgi:non-heme chloroperoxidase